MKISIPIDFDDENDEIGTPTVNYATMVLGPSPLQLIFTNFSSFLHSNSMAVSMWILDLTMYVFINVSKFFACDLISVWPLQITDVV